MPAAAKTKRIVRQKAKGPIDPGVGLKVRELRSARGMTQAELAGPDFSKGFISLLETGRTRVSLRAAGILAGRLGVDVTDLLAAPTTDQRDLEFMLLRAEQSLKGGETKIAIEIAAKWASKASGILRARFQRLQGRALGETARSREAITLLDDALRSFRRLAAKDQAARTLFDLAVAFARVDSPGEALRYVLEAEQAVQRGDVIDRTLELEIHQLAAALYIALGDMASAQTRAELGRALAEDIADPNAVARTYQSLALSRFEEGDKEAAFAYARKSLDLFESIGQQEKVAETWNTLGWLFIKREQYGKAAEALDKAERMAGEHGNTRLAVAVGINRAALALAKGANAEAQRLAESAIEAPGAIPRMRARGSLVRARAIAASDASLAQVKKAFDEAIAAHKGESAREQARAHEAYSDALAARKQAGEALEEAKKALQLVGPRI